MKDILARDSVEAYFFVDMAHIAGLVAAKLIPSPVSYTDFVSFTTFKTMMGGRGGIILCKKEYDDAVDKAVFPGTLGTSAVSNIAGKATIAKLAKEANFIDVQRKTLESIGIITNRNYIPKDTGKGASGLRLGTGPISVRGIEKDYVIQIAKYYR